MEAAVERVCAEADEALADGVNVLILSDRAVGAERARDPVAAGRRRRAPPPRARGHAPADRPRARVRRAARGAPLRDADRLRRRGDQPVPDVRVARRARRATAGARRRRRRDGRDERRQGHRQGPAQDDLQDGDLDDPVLQRRADLRGRRPRHASWSTALRRHRLAHRRHRDRRAGPGDARQARPRLSAGRRGPAAGRRHLRVAPRGRAPHVEPGDDRAAPARGAPRRQARPTRSTRGSSTRTRRARATLRGLLRFRSCPRTSGSRSTRWSRAGDRQALRHRRDVARLAVARGARDAGDRHEPDRRQVEHRRGRRGPRPLHARPERRLAPLAPSSRSPRAASA